MKKKFEIKSSAKVDAVFEKYPAKVRPKMEALRKLIIDTAKKTESIARIEETLKWGEPSYLTKKGSTIRMDWKERAPDQYALYFTCTTSLVPTFKVVFNDLFEYEGNRAIVFNLSDKLPKAQLKRCIEASLTYHSVKQLPLLGL